MRNPILHLLTKPALRLLSPGGRRGKLSVFLFHRVLPFHDPLLPNEPDAEQFEWMIRLISECFSVIPLGEATERLAQGKLPPAAASITFDDGYADNLTVALPILRKYDVAATFFIATGFLNGGRMWNDDVIEAVRISPPGEIDWGEFDLGQHEVSDSSSRVRCYGAVLRKLKYFQHAQRSEVAREIARRAGVLDRSNLMMTDEQLIELHNYEMEIGGHTHSHPILECLPDSEAEREIEEGRIRLESLLGVPVSIFAYPNGVLSRDYSARHVAMVKRLGFRAAVSTAVGFSKTGDDPHQIPRFTPWDRTPAEFAMRCVRNLSGI